MQTANIIIGHAGAGTCIEALDLQKPFIAVINETLLVLNFNNILRSFNVNLYSQFFKFKIQNNHQRELSERLAEDNHLLYTTPDALNDTLQNPQLFRLKSFPKADPQIFASYMTRLKNSQP